MAPNRREGRPGKAAPQRDTRWVLSPSSEPAETSASKATPIFAVLDVIRRVGVNPRRSGGEAR